MFQEGEPPAEQTPQQKVERFLYYHRQVEPASQDERESDLQFKLRIEKENDTYLNRVLSLMTRIGQHGKRFRTGEALEIVDSGQLSPQEKIEKLNRHLNQWGGAIRAEGKVKSAKVPLGVAKELLGQAANPESETGFPDVLEEMLRAEEHLWSQIKD